jgi:hypothetical protein
VPLSYPAEKLPLPKDGIHRIQKHRIVTDVVLLQKMGVGTEVSDDMYPGASRSSGFESSSELTGQPSDLGVIVTPAAKILSGIHQVVHIVFGCYQQLVDRCNCGLAMRLSQLQAEGSRRSTGGTDGLYSGGPVKPSGIRWPRIRAGPPDVREHFARHPAGECPCTGEFAAKDQGVKARLIDEDGGIIQVASITAALVSRRRSQST